MVKTKSRYVCQNCGASFVKWAGRCENCGEWNTLLEQAPSVEAESKTALSRGAVSGKKLEAVSINTIEPSDAGSRLSTSFADLDAVLGGGLLLGSVNLLAGQPGIGKSTLLMQICAAVAEGRQVLYVSGEESAGQVKLRAIRLGHRPINCTLRARLPAMISLKRLKVESMTLSSSIQFRHYHWLKLVRRLAR